VALAVLSQHFQASLEEQYCDVHQGLEHYIQEQLLLQSQVKSEKLFQTFFHSVDFQ
jgi:hypothetical protein